MVGYNASKRKLTPLNIVFAGATSGLITRMICQPLDVLKIRFQLQVEPISANQVSKYKSIFHATNLIIKEEGIKALWKGNVPAQLLSVTYGILQFWTFEKLTEEAYNLNLSSKLNPVVNFACGSISGCTATAVSFPLDFVRTRLVAQSEQHRVYSGVLEAFRSIVKDEGFFVLYRGMWPTLLQIAPHAGIQFMCYKMYHHIYKYLTNTQTTTILSSLVAGSLAGLCAKTSVYPLDLAKKRLQIQGFERGRTHFGEFFKCRGLTDCIMRIYKVEGVNGLFKGLSPSLLKAVATSALYFSTYEMICKFLQEREQ